VKILTRKASSDSADDEEVDFKEIVKNEEADLRGNYEAFSKGNYLFPHFGPVFTIFNFFYLIHKTIIAFYIPYKCAFESSPTWGSVGFDFYLDFIFLIEILINFNLPVYDLK